MTPRQRNALLVVGAIGIAFGGGSVWQFLQARQARAERDSARAELATAQQALAVERLEATLAMATMAAQFGNYERGRQLASDFFTGLEDVAAAAPESGQAGLTGILAGRDALITALSRSEPESGPDLARTLTLFQRALGRDVMVPAPLQPGPGEGPG